MKRAPVDAAREIKGLERRRRQLARAIGALQQAIDVLREHEAFVADTAEGGAAPRRRQR